MYVGPADTTKSSSPRKKGDFISPLERALLCGVQTPGYDDESSEDDSTSSDLGAPSTPGTLWSLVVNTFSPPPKLGLTSISTEVDSLAVPKVDSDDTSFQSAMSHESGDAVNNAEGILSYRNPNDVDDTSQDPYPLQTLRPSNSSVHFQLGEQTPISLLKPSWTPSATASQRKQIFPTPLSRQRSSKRKKRRSSVLQQTDKKNIVLEDIGADAANSEFTLDFHSPGTPWTKVILLEDLGTASSWLVLLLPYFTFLLALALDSTSILQDVTLAPRSGRDPCLHGNGANVSSIFPLSPIPQEPCSYAYKIEEGKGMLSLVNRNNDIVDRRYEFFMASGIAVTTAC